MLTWDKWLGKRHVCALKIDGKVLSLAVKNRKMMNFFSREYSHLTFEGFYGHVRVNVCILFLALEKKKDWRRISDLYKVFPYESI